ncbi:unnamed protein product [Amoebophrya sp. A120]|nr:unnamed protein product [Amoebophrya sp. A120]|eukprot:GSA120T00017961001.1
MVERRSLGGLRRPGIPSESSSARAATKKMMPSFADGFRLFTFVPFAAVLILLLPDRTLALRASSSRAASVARHKIRSRGAVVNQAISGTANEDTSAERETRVKTSSAANAFGSSSRTSSEIKDAALLRRVDEKVAGEVEVDEGEQGRGGGGPKAAEVVEARSVRISSPEQDDQTGAWVDEREDVDSHHLNLIQSGNRRGDEPSDADSLPAFDEAWHELTRKYAGKSTVDFRAKAAESAKIILGIFTEPNQDQARRAVLRDTWMKQEGVCLLNDYPDGESDACDVFVVFVVSGSSVISAADLAKGTDVVKLSLDGIELAPGGQASNSTGILGVASTTATFLQVHQKEMTRGRRSAKTKRAKTIETKMHRGGTRASKKKTANQEEREQASLANKLQHFRDGTADTARRDDGDEPTQPSSSTNATDASNATAQTAGEESDFSGPQKSQLQRGNSLLFLWMYHAPREFSWATHIGKIEMTTFPLTGELFEDVSKLLSKEMATGCESYVGSCADFSRCGSFSFCPPKGCGCPVEEDFMKYSPFPAGSQQQPDGGSAQQPHALAEISPREINTKFLSDKDIQSMDDETLISLVVTKRPSDDLPPPTSNSCKAPKPDPNAWWTRSFSASGSFGPKDGGARQEEIFKNYRQYGGDRADGAMYNYPGDGPPGGGASSPQQQARIQDLERQLARIKASCGEEDGGGGGKTKMNPYDNVFVCYRNCWHECCLKNHGCGNCEKSCMQTCPVEDCARGGGTTTTKYGAKAFEHCVGKDCHTTVTDGRTNIVAEKPSYTTYKNPDKYKKSSRIFRVGRDFDDPNPELSSDNYPEYWKGDQYQHYQQGPPTGGPPASPNLYKQALERQQYHYGKAGEKMDYRDHFSNAPREQKASGSSSPPGGDGDYVAGVFQASITDKANALRDLDEKLSYELMHAQQQLHAVLQERSQAEASFGKRSQQLAQAWRQLMAYGPLNHRNYAPYAVGNMTSAKPGSGAPAKMNNATTNGTGTAGAKSSGKEVALNVERLAEAADAESAQEDVKLAEAEVQAAKEKLEALRGKADEAAKAAAKLKADEEKRKTELLQDFENQKALADEHAAAVADGSTSSDAATVADEFTQLAAKAKAIEEEKKQADEATFPASQDAEDGDATGNAEDETASLVSTDRATSVVEKSSLAPRLQKFSGRKAKGARKPSARLGEKQTQLSTTDPDVQRGGTKTVAESERADGEIPVGFAPKRHSVEKGVHHKKTMDNIKEAKREEQLSLSVLLPSTRTAKGSATSEEEPGAVAATGVAPGTSGGAGDEPAAPAFLQILRRNHRGTTSRFWPFNTGDDDSTSSSTSSTNSASAQRAGPPSQTGSPEAESTGASVTPSAEESGASASLAEVEPKLAKQKNTGAGDDAVEEDEAEDGEVVADEENEEEVANKASSPSTLLRTKTDDHKPVLEISPKTGPKLVYDVAPETIKNPPKPDFLNRPPAADGSPDSQLPGGSYVPVADEEASGYTPPNYRVFSKDPPLQDMFDQPVFDPWRYESYQPPAPAPAPPFAASATGPASPLFGNEKTQNLARSWRKYLLQKHPVSEIQNTVSAVKNLSPGRVHPLCWSYMCGSLVLLSRNMAEKITAPSGAYAKNLGGHAAITLGAAVADHSHEQQQCVHVMKTDWQKPWIVAEIR